ncbi:hypothetical protein AX17_004109 [Amanita inopinata Kibby_2008]|nr:hypothetical protein AX17_004127 [Amanita inopinata Kibby_2008]KAF8634779.1 hypothetical protein AX17_004109 [Amanita inopinata Kibby_2008]
MSTTTVCLLHATITFMLVTPLHLFDLKHVRYLKETVTMVDQDAQQHTNVSTCMVMVLLIPIMGPPPLSATLLFKRYVLLFRPMWKETVGSDKPVGPSDQGCGKTYKYQIGCILRL